MSEDPVSGARRACNNFPAKKRTISRAQLCQCQAAPLKPLLDPPPQAILRKLHGGVQVVPNGEGKVCSKGRLLLDALSMTTDVGNLWRHPLLERPNYYALVPSDLRSNSECFSSLVIP